jgi:hypothetical protein
MAENRDHLPAEACSLGKLQAEYRPGLFRPLFLGLAGSVAILLVLTLLVNLALAFLLAFLIGPPTHLPWGHPLETVLFIIVVAGLGWLGGHLLRRAWQLHGGRVLVMTEGLVQVWRGQIVLARWEEIIWIWRREECDSPLFPERCFLRLELADGQNLYLANHGLLLPCLVLPAARFLALRTEVERETNLRKLPVLLEALNEGKTVTFDQLSISQAGVGWKGETWSWEQIFHIEYGHTPFLRFGQLRWALVLLGGRQIRFVMDEIPNLALLWALIEIVRADSFAPRKEWRSQLNQASRHAADPHDHISARDRFGLPAAQEPSSVADL